MTKTPQLISSSRYLLSISYRKLHLKTESSVHLDSLAANTVLHLHKILRRYLENEYQAYYNLDTHNNLLCVHSIQSTVRTRPWWPMGKNRTCLTFWLAMSFLRNWQKYLCHEWRATGVCVVCVCVSECVLIVWCVLILCDIPTFFASVLHIDMTLSEKLWMVDQSSFSILQETEKEREGGKRERQTERERGREREGGRERERLYKCICIYMYNNRAILLWAYITCSQRSRYRLI